jgi:hypothetical protein
MGRVCGGEVEEWGRGGRRPAGRRRGSHPQIAMRCRDCKRTKKVTWSENRNGSTGFEKDRTDNEGHFLKGSDACRTTSI